jgi:hypothetical protein
MHFVLGQVRQQLDHTFAVACRRVQVQYHSPQHQHLPIGAVDPDALLAHATAIDSAAATEIPAVLIPFRKLRREMERDR